MSHPELTFHYWPVKARNWFILLVSSVGDVPVKWERTGNDDSWRSWSPFGQLPLLQIKPAGAEKAEVLSQSLAIARYIAKLGGILGDNAFQEARSDELIQAWDDVTNLISKAHYDANRKAAMDTLFAEKVPAKLKQFEALLHGETFFADGKVRAGDLAIFAGLDIVLSLQADALDATPKLRHFYDKLAADPKVKAVTSLEGVWPYFKRE
eukprot:TRINITY_DN650_c0_g1_i1.p1 TRINITY_DN650_c0_g1~~TRINITY_DN650_c0_g1_i1.p1  ORF type:complete len:221 (-),score=71.42 TRINITY_DN650_c0_g1_i1:113-739(-)